MHEMTLAADVLQIIEHAVRREGLRRVRAVCAYEGEAAILPGDAALALGQAAVALARAKG